MATDVRDFSEHFFSSLRDGITVAVVPHVQADGDALGSGLALAALLRKLGCKADLLLDEPVPERLRFIAESDQALVYSGKEEADLLFVIDCHEPHRLGRRTELWDKIEKRFVIDHHQYQDLPRAEEWMESSRSSTAEMIAVFLAEAERRFDREFLDLQIAEQLVCGIYADTGGLRFSNSGVETYRIMARLRASGAAVDQISEAMFARSTLGKLRGRGLAFQKATWRFGGRIAWVFFSNEEKAACSATDDDLGGICSDLREVVGTDVAFFFQTDESGERLRISIRSTEALNAAALASRWGGGGHQRAAGADVEPAGRALTDLCEQILLDAERMLTEASQT